MYIKKIILLAFILFSPFLLADETKITFEVIEVKMDVLVQKDIEQVFLKKDAANQPYVDLVLTEEGVNQVTKITEKLKGKTINIWIGKYPISLSVPVHSALTSKNIRVPMESLKEAESLISLLKGSGAS